ncbi:MAG: hypothetical protein IPJ07_04715 [Acidobacteria bacterium]|nr:hypothetical protein [Acidobacteriota bacterium]
MKLPAKKRADPEVEKTVVDNSMAPRRASGAMFSTMTRARTWSDGWRGNDWQNNGAKTGQLTGITDTQN